MSTNRSLLFIGAGILALVVLAVGVVLLAEARGPATFAAGGPEETMQRYLAAWDERDYEAAYAFFSEEVRADVTLDEYEQQARAYGGEFSGFGEIAVYIDNAVVDGDRATLHLTVEQFYDDGGGLGGGGSSFRTEREVRMVQEAAGWKVDEPLIGIEQIPFGEFPF
jgi:hypothetical protein